jgi:DNA-binding transcriptional LysR family regulator
MDCFLRVSRSGSFTAAATQLSQSPAAVARQINALEASLGVRLLNRSTRSISLTDAGKTYAEMCQRVVEDITQCETRLSAIQREPSGSVKIIVPKSLGSMQLGDAVIAFSQKHPNIAISILFEDFAARPHDFVERGYDLALRWGADVRNSTLVSSQLGTLTRKLCASPRYIKEQGHPEIPADLEHHNCLLHLIAYADRVWRFADGEREIGVKVTGDFAADSAIMLRKAALAGRGVAILPLYCLQDDLKSGALVELLPNYPIPRTPISLLYREKRLLPSRVRLFIDFLRDWFGRYADAL